MVDLHWPVERAAQGKGKILFKTIALITLYISLPIFLSACQPPAETTTSNRNNLRISNLLISASENELKSSSDFEYFPGGHFGDKTQYNGKVADEFGGSTAVHCRKGKVFNIEFKYQGEGISRNKALEKLDKVLPPEKGTLIEHDDEDLKLKDCNQAAEFFYYQNGTRAEFLYADHSVENVKEISLWAG